MASGNYNPATSTIEVYTRGRSIRGIARTLIHEGYHKYLHHLMNLERPKNSALYRRLYDEMKVGGYSGTFEYRAFQYANQYSKLLGIEPKSGSPYILAGHSYDAFSRYYAERRRWSMARDDPGPIIFPK